MKRRLRVRIKHFQNRTCCFWVFFNAAKRVPINRRGGGENGEVKGIALGCKGTAAHTLNERVHTCRVQGYGHTVVVTAAKVDYSHALVRKGHNGRSSPPDTARIIVESRLSWWILMRVGWWEGALLCK